MEKKNKRERASFQCHINEKSRLELEETAIVGQLFQNVMQLYHTVALSYTGLMTSTISLTAVISMKVKSREPDQCEPSVQMRR